MASLFNSRQCAGVTARAIWDEVRRRLRPSTCKSSVQKGAGGCWSESAYVNAERAFVHHVAVCAPESLDHDENDPAKPHCSGRTQMKQSRCLPRWIRRGPRRTPPDVTVLRRHQVESHPVTCSCAALRTVATPARRGWRQVRPGTSRSELLRRWLEPLDQHGRVHSEPGSELADVVE